jgi:hypothetical protein
MHYHLFRPDLTRKLKPLEQSALHHCLNGRIATTNIESMERPMNAKPTRVASKHAPNELCPFAPVAIEAMRVDGVLNLEVTLG